MYWSLSRTSHALGGRAVRASGRRRSGLRSQPVAGAELAQEFVGLHEEWVLVEKPVDDDQRMGAEDIHHDAGAEFAEVVRADDNVVVLG